MRQVFEPLPIKFVPETPDPIIISWSELLVSGCVNAPKYSP